MKKMIFLLLLCLSAGLVRAQHEVIYSQYMFNNLLINPAYAGYKEDINITLLNRNQWVGIKDAPTTQSFIIDGAFFNNKNVGLGLSVMNDKVGIQGQTSFMANYAYRLPVGENSRLSFGLGLGAIQFTLNGNNAVVGDGSDRNFSGQQTYFSPDARFGIYFSNDRFYAGASVNNALTKILNENKERAKYVILPPTNFFLTVGGLLNVNESLKFKPSLMLRQDPNGYGNFDTNLSFLIKETLWLGASYRMGVDMLKNNQDINKTFQQNSLIGLVEVFIAKSVRVGYAFDYSLSKLNGYTGGSHEISVGLTIGKKEKYNALTSPRYF
ncbi:PorP/SprF family type IX secretion system membrane protein [Pedobacter montanisoli]|uniref:Type IX secretion system membrane protein PorP/SprF n=1 Tax=Pedobacter montanisoli TaxID=2923277 RepID=A0ABS9ZX10_9SPHI|nr:type IX secretion system membrane protein PorP/SprF [Pedobacter montanisoli]MCJ0742854.1 type IX secretion system membrane protein PorP/SprF [Pedobacter montanisoli]